MPTRLCSHERCPHPVHYRGRCREHARTNERRTHNPEHKRIYNTAKWRHTREAVLSTTPLCHCGAIATDVHHLVDLADGGDPWSRSNLEALCHECHAQITRRGQATR
jgi:5-methylcytosine-specific restriction protein A